jgi:hypothetical protein
MGIITIGGKKLNEDKKGKNIKLVGKQIDTLKKIRLLRISENRLLFLLSSAHP